MHRWSFGRLHRPCHPWCHPKWTLWHGHQEGSACRTGHPWETVKRYYPSSSLFTVSSFQKKKEFLPNTVTIYPLPSRSGRRGNTPLLPQYLQGLRGRGPRLDQEIPPNKSRLLQGQSPQQSHAPCASPTINAKRTLNNGCPAPTTTHVAYSCPQRGAVPQRPPELLFPCWPENNAKMKDPSSGRKTQARGKSLQGHRK